MRDTPELASFPRAVLVARSGQPDRMEFFHPFETHDAFKEVLASVLVAVLDSNVVYYRSRLVVKSHAILIRTQVFIDLPK